MRLGILAKDKPEKVYVAIKNNESSTVANGTPVCWAMTGTDDGVLTELPNTTSAAKAQALLAGVVAKLDGIKSNEFGVAQVYGFCLNTVVIRQTRAASTDSFATAAAVALGDVFQVTTVGNGMQRTGAGASALHMHYCVAAESAASIAGVASTTSNSSLFLTAPTLKTFLRIM